MSSKSSTVRSLLNRFGTILESILVFILLISGAAFVLIAKQSGQIGPGFSLFTIGISVEIIAIIIVGFYIYFRMLRRRDIVPD